MTEENPVYDHPTKDIQDRPSRARYEKVRSRLEMRWRRREPKFDRMMADVVEILWESFAENPYAGCGFWLLPKEDGEWELRQYRGDRTLAAKGLAGARAKAVGSGRPEVVEEGGCARVAVPVADVKGRVFAVLEAVSEKTGVFNDMDQRWLERIVRSFRLAEKAGGG